MYTCLLFLINRDKDSNVITDVCLAKKKRGFGKDLWHGVGGKFEFPDKKYEDTVIRETKEEINVTPISFYQKAGLNVRMPLFSEELYFIEVYLCDKWQGNPEETEEMSPQWFKTKDIPYGQMIEDVKYWLPLLLEEKSLEANINYVNHRLVSCELKVL